MTRQSLISRRRVLGVFGAGTTVALAGCSGNEQEGPSNGDSASGGNGTDSPSGSGGTSGGNGSDADGTGDGSQGTEDSSSTGSTGNEPGEYPTQETSGLMNELDSLAESQEGVYAFRIDDMSYLQIEEFPNIADEFPNESSFEELAESSQTIEGYEKALYVAANMDHSWVESDDIYFLIGNPELSEGAVIRMFKDSENNPAGFSDGEGQAVGYPPEGGLGVEPEQGKEYQEEFFRDHVDPNGIVHAVDLAEHDYAVEALHSGFGSE